MKRKSVISILLAAAFALQAAGCAQQEGGSEAGSQASSSAQSASAGAAPAEKDYSEKLTISWGVYGDQVADINTGDDFAKMWGERFNVEWDLIMMSYDTWNEKVRIWANSQDLPDVTQWEYNNVDGALYAEQGLVRRLPDDWQTRWPNTAEAFKGTEVGPKLTENFGGTYFLPRPVFANNKPTEVLVSHQGIYMRKDWIEAVGAEVKPYYTVEELLDVARLIKEKDPGNVGDKLIPIGNGPNELPLIFVNPVSTYSTEALAYYKDDAGKYQWGPASQDTLQGLKYYEQAYREGLISPEFFTQNAGNNEQNFNIAGISGMFQAPGMAQVAFRYANNFKESLGLEVEDWMNFAFCVGQDGKFYGAEAANYWGSLMFSPKLSDEKFERVMDVLDYSCTDQGQNEIRMGIEGVDWELDENGELVNLIPDGVTAIDKYYSIRPFYHNMYICSDDFGLVNPAYPKVFRDMSYNQYQTKSSLIGEGTLGRINWDVDFYDSEAKRRTLFNLADEYAGLVVAEGEMEDKWNAWVAEKMQLVQPVLDELNAL